MEQDVCTFGLSEKSEMVDLEKIEKATDPSIWRDLTIYQDNRGKADEFSGLSATLEQTKQWMNVYVEEMNEIVSLGLGLTQDKYEIIRRRCQQFPLSVTVESPRYVWSPIGSVSHDASTSLRNASEHN